MITGVLIPFDADHDTIPMKDLAKEVRDKFGYCTDIVLMDSDTYNAVCTKSEGGQDE